MGCSGWRNVPWKDDFYPKSILSSGYLSYYASIFDFVEVTLTYSRTGRSEFSINALAKKWDQQTPPRFRFGIRIPASILNENTDHQLGGFIKEIAPLREKVTAVLLDVHSSITLTNGREWLERMIETCTDQGYRVAAQFGSTSWYQDLAYNILKKHKTALVWSDNHPTTVRTADFLYLRIGASNQRIWLEKLREISEEEIKQVILVLDSPAQSASFCKEAGIVKTKCPPMTDTGMTYSPTQSLRQTLASSQKRKWKGSVIICVDLNAFYPSCEELREPALKGMPHAVIMTDQKTGEITKGVVSSCSYDARKFGVRSAMSLTRALSLCPELVLRPVDIPYYSTISGQVMKMLEEYADVLEQASIDEAFLDCTTKLGSENPEAYALKIKQAIRQKTGLLCSIGATSTKSSAKIASDYKKPDGLTVVYPEDLKGFLGPLGVDRVSGVGPKTQQALREMGIETLGQLAQADVQMLTERFGKNGYWMWTVANGSDGEKVKQREDHVSLSTETTLEVFTRDKSIILQKLLELVDELYERADRRGYVFRTVGVRIVRTDFSIETREHTYDDLQGRYESIACLIEMLLDKFMLQGERPAVRKVGLKISHLVRKRKIGTKVTQKSLLEFYD